MSDTRHSQEEIDAFRQRVLYGELYGQATPAPDDSFLDKFLPLLAAFVTGVGVGCAVGIFAQRWL